MNKIILLVVVLLLLGGGAFLFLRNSNTQPANIVTEQSPSPTTTDAQQTVTESATPTINDAMEEEVVNVSLTSSGFSSASITIRKGTKVVWMNSSGAQSTVDSAPHPVHTSYPKMNLGSFGDGEILEFIFNEPGTYNYHNHFRSSQTGTVIVEE